MRTLQKLLFLFFCLILLSNQSEAQSVPRQWNEALINAIRKDFARPPVHARNLFHVSMAMYDAWAAYDSTAQTYLLGKTVGNYTCTFNGVPAPPDIEAAREMAISYAAYRVLYNRFLNSPNAFLAISSFNDLMTTLGYDYNYTSTNYANGNPAALGNYIGQCVIQMGYQDNSNEQNNYASVFYQPVNPPLVMANPGNPSIIDPNRWQPLTLVTAVDQNGNPIPSTQTFQSPEWGHVVPFALSTNDLAIHQRNNHDYYVYHDPGPQPLLDTTDSGDQSLEFKWNMELVTAWSSHHDPNDGVMWDISPKSLGNIQSYPTTLEEYHNFYNFENGGDSGIGREINPRTGQPYQPQIVPRGDYTRVLAQFWADGPTSETPPGHWFVILNYVSDQPSFVKRFNGQGPVMNDMEWYVKAYFTLGGAVHDAAVTCWGIKGWYDAVRPVSSLRYMAGLGQSSAIDKPHFHPGGVTLIPGYVELVNEGDSLAGPNNENVNKIKFYTWRGPNAVTDPTTQIAGVGWILAENWWPYQRKTFVTPPFGGYMSGHSTYSRAAAETLTFLTGDEYFPGGLGEFHIPANSNFLGLEKGPSVDVTLQWATYRDASDQTSLSRIWGGIHPPFDDIPARRIGAEIAVDVFNKAKTYFYKDLDNDGHFSYEDCNDSDASVYNGAPELCDGIDNNCNGMIDDSITVYSYYADADGDGYGAGLVQLDTCASIAPFGFSANNTDCDDSNVDIHPNAGETCDGIDNDCNNAVDDNIPLYTYYKDSDGDAFGDPTNELLSCQTQAPANFVDNNLDCNDNDNTISPISPEKCDSIDNNCDGLVDNDLPDFKHYLDADGDAFGNGNEIFTSCEQVAPAGYVNNFEDCNDSDNAINPNATEVCDGVDNNCDGFTDDLTIYTYYIDTDGDGFGSISSSVDTCDNTAPLGYVNNPGDCNDADAAINPNAIEVCDGQDNNCNAQVDELPVFTFYLDADHDGYGSSAQSLDTCITSAPTGYAINNLDCNDSNPNIHPGAEEVLDGLDNDCNGMIDDVVNVADVSLVCKIYPNPVNDYLTVDYSQGGSLQYELMNASGQILASGNVDFKQQKYATLNLTNFASGLYIIHIYEPETKKELYAKVIKLKN